MAYRMYNPNPYGLLVGDCVVRAISTATGKDWKTVYIELAMQGYSMGDMPSSNSVWGAYLMNEGYARHVLPDNCPDCYTVSEFCVDNPEGKFILATGSHVVCVIDGDYMDIWDSGQEVPVFYWKKEE